MRDATYTIQSHGPYWFEVGVAANRQLLWTPCGASTLLIVSFDESGDLLSTDRQPLVGDLRAAFDAAGRDLRNRGYKDTPIKIRGFWIPEDEIGVRELPESLQEFIDDPETFDHEETENLTDCLQEWRDEGMFVFYCGEEFELDATGQVLSH